jgi:hypothetical protein
MQGLTVTLFFISRQCIPFVHGLFEKPMSGDIATATRR